VEGITENSDDSAALRSKVDSLEKRLRLLWEEHGRLLETEALLDQLASLTKAVFWKTDRNGLITTINENSEPVMGYSPKEVIGRMHFYDLHPEEGREEYRKSCMKVFEKREAFVNHINPAVTSSGRRIWLITNGIPILGPGGSLKGYQGIDVDITERKNAEDALRVKNYVFHCSIAANSISDTRGVVSEVNDAFLRIWGYESREEVIGKYFTRFLAEPRDTGPFIEIMRSRGSWTGDFRAKRRDGSTFTAQGQVTVVADETGRHIGFQSSMLDVTASRNVSDRLRESEARNRALLNALPDLMFLLDADGVFVDYHASNPGQLLIPPEAFLGRRITEVLPENIASPTLACMRNVALGREASPFRYEASLRGETRFFESRIVTCAEDRFLTIIRDVTDLVMAEMEHEDLQDQLRQAQKMESVGRLAGGVAHDFNNMLSVILGHSEMALDKLPPSHPASEDLNEIRKSAERSADLTRQLLAFARRQSVSPRVVDLNDVVQGMMNMLRRLIGEDIELQWSPGRELWPVLADPSQVTHMLANLCINARQAIPGAGRIGISTENAVIGDDYCQTHPGSKPGDYALVTITDNGIGMNRETLDHIFEPFFTTRQQGQGTGLGLATVYGIVKQSNGYIEVSSEPGRGTAFKVYLPKTLEPAEPRTREQPVPAALGGDETILLVEDEKSILEMAGIMLESLGYHVLYASTPRRAVELAEMNRDLVHLLITDVVMPERNGRDLAHILREIIPGLRCLFMSGYTSNVIAQHGILDEGMHFIPKPFTSRALAASVRTALDQPAAENRDSC
jgi:PAS domain S-box-containing protein